MNGNALDDTARLCMRFLDGVSKADLQELHVVCHWNLTYLFSHFIPDWWEGIRHACIEPAVRLNLVTICLEFPCAGELESLEHWVSQDLAPIVVNDCYTLYVSPLTSTRSQFARNIAMYG